ncbi:292_t:CDS:1 [Paraglomus brasilianum]|uniref:292_t:CDS:1 n=1 Tax=Paraglomus brasilianum TaxID=144538 RepID=A0A9N9EZ24_9GLOM|nr:292_t:CDS:1 [Paraglomus brasilianum]
MATFTRRETAEIEETTTESHETTDQNRPEVIMPIPIRPIRATPIAVRPRPPTPNSESPKHKMRKTERSSDGAVSSETEQDEAYSQANSNKITRQAQESNDETERMNNSTSSSANSTNSAANKVSLENLTTMANGEPRSVDGNSRNNTTNVRMNNTPEITTKYNVVKIAPKIAPKIEDNRQSVIDFDKMVDDRSKQKLYPCPKCDRPFSRKFNMESHLTTHDPHRVKPFLCDYLGCGHRFTRKHDLKRHVNGIHKCEKQHRCPHCEKTFARKDAWKRHSFTCTINTEIPRMEKKIDSDAVRISLLANADATSVVAENYVNK